MYLNKKYWKRQNVKIHSEKVEFFTDKVAKKGKDYGTASKNEDSIETQCHLTLQNSSFINHAVCGFFLNSDQKDFAFSRGKIIDVSKVDIWNKGAKADIKIFCSINLFGSICDMKTLAIPWKICQDSLVVATDAGKLFILEYLSKKKKFKKISFEYASPDYASDFTINSPECFLATHPSGYAFLMCRSLNEVSLFIRISTTKNKIIKNTFLKQVISISGEIYDIVGIPSDETCIKFALLRFSEECKQDVVILTFNERKLVKKVEDLSSSLKMEAEKLNWCFTANLIVPVVTRSTNGPFGVLVFSTSCIIYKSLDTDNLEISVFIPGGNITAFNHSAVQHCHAKAPKDKVFICATYYSESEKDSEKYMQYFALAEDGDLFVVSIILDEMNKATELKFLKIESFPSAKHLCMLNKKEEEYLFVTFENSNHCLFKIDRKFLSVTEKEDMVAEEIGRRFHTKKFTPIKSIQNNFPVFDFLVEYDSDTYSKLHLICKKWPQSALQILELGFKVICGASKELECDPIFETFLYEINHSEASFETSVPSRTEVSLKIANSAVVTNMSSKEDESLHSLTEPNFSDNQKSSSFETTLSKHKSSFKISFKHEFVSKSEVSSKSGNSPKTENSYNPIVSSDSNEKSPYGTDSTEYLLFISHKKRTTVASIEMSSDSVIDYKYEDQKNFITEEHTLFCIPWGKSGYLQVTPHRLIYVRDVLIWSHHNFDAPYIKCIATRYCVLVYSEDLLLHYFSYENDSITAALPCESMKEITCFAIGEKRKISDSPLIAIALKDDSVLLAYFEKQKESCCKPNYICKLKYDAVNYLEIVSLKTTNKEQSINSEYIFASNEEYLFIGRKNSIIIYKLNSYEVPDKVKEYHLYSEGIIMCKITLWEKQSILVYLADKTNKWILIHRRNDWQLHVCNFDDSLKHVMSFSSERFQNKLLIIDSNHQLKLGRVTRFEKGFSKTEIPLVYSTPRVILYDKIIKKLLVLESERISFGEAKCSYKEHVCQFPNHVFKTEGKQWIPCIEIIDPALLMEKQKPIFLDLHKSDIILCGCKFDYSSTESVLILGILTKYGERCKRSGTMTARSYKITYEADSIFISPEIDRIFLEGLTSEMRIVQGKVFIPQGNHLGIYTFDTDNSKLILMNKKKLFDDIAAMDFSFDADADMEELILIGHSTFNISILKVSDLEILIEDCSFRPIKSAIFVNHSTFAIADTFGNIFTMSLSKKNVPFEYLLKEEFEVKIESLFHVGEPIRKIQLIKLHPDANPLILYVSVYGSVGVLLEVSQKGDVFLKKLKSHLKSKESLIYCSNLEEFYPLCDQPQFIIDGDLCENYISKPLCEKKENETVDKIRKKGLNMICANFQNLKLQNSIFSE